jgi:hypothetical protein
MQRFESFKETIRHSINRHAHARRDEDAEQAPLDFRPSSNRSLPSRSLEEGVRPSSQLVKAASQARVSTGTGSIVGQVEWVPDPSGNGMVPNITPAEVEEEDEPRSEAALHAKMVIEEAIRKEAEKLDPTRRRGSSSKQQVPQQ